MQLVHKLARLLLPLALFEATTATPALSQAVQVTCSTSQQSMCYREYANCSISPASNVDVYQFFGESGDVVRITIAGLSGGVSPRFDLIRPSGTQLSVATAEK